jgi:hypothetical protein
VEKIEEKALTGFYDMYVVPQGEEANAKARCGICGKLFKVN